MLDGDMAYLRKIPNFVSGNVLRLCSDFLALIGLSILFYEFFSFKVVQNICYHGKEFVCIIHSKKIIC